MQTQLDLKKKKDMCFINTLPSLYPLYHRQVLLQCRATRKWQDNVQTRYNDAAMRFNGAENTGWQADNTVRERHSWCEALSSSWQMLKGEGGAERRQGKGRDSEGERGESFATCGEKDHQEAT